MADPEVPISHSTAVPIDGIAEGVRGLRIAFVNVFGVEHANGTWTLIDAGLPFSAAHIRHWAEETFGGGPAAIVLTHGHFDHVSAAGELGDEWDVPIYAHALETPYLTGQKQYPPPRVGAGGGLMSYLSPLYPRGPVDLGARLRQFPAGADGEQTGVLPEWQVVHTPGHTAGHVSLFRQSDGTLLVGDAFCTTKPESFFEAAIAQEPELHGPPAYFTADPAVAAVSIGKLAALRPRVIAPGHGRPLAGTEVQQKLTLLAAEFAAAGGASENRHVA